MTITTDHKSTFDVQVFDDGEKIANLPYAFIKHATGVDLFTADEKTTHKTLGLISREFQTAIENKDFKEKGWPLSAHVDLALQGIRSKSDKITTPLTTVPTAQVA